MCHRGTKRIGGRALEKKSPPIDHPSSAALFQSTFSPASLVLKAGLETGAKADATRAARTTNLVGAMIDIFDFAR